MGKESNILECPLCPHHCRLRPGQTGRCRARVHYGRRIRGLDSDHLASIALDPIEKKPLYRFHPGSMILSVGLFGCNLRCPFCQNASISMTNGRHAADGSHTADDRQTTDGGANSGESPSPADRLCPEIAPDDAESINACVAHKLVQTALSLQARGNIGIAFTYNEPLCRPELIRSTFLAAREAGLKTALITNGCFSADVIRSIAPLTDAWNIDLKAFTEDGYRQLGGDLETVKTAISIAAAHSHVEVTTLVVPGFNDSDAEIHALASWLADSVPNGTLHLSRFFPRYRWSDRRPTDVHRLFHLAALAKEVYPDIHLGNV